MGDRKRQRGQERDRKRRRDQLRKPNHRGIRERARETGKQKGRELFPLGLWEKERESAEKRARSVCVRPVVGLINLWQEGFRCSVPWIAALIYMVIFFKSLAAYKNLLFQSLLSLNPLLYSLHIYIYICERSAVIFCTKCDAVWEIGGRLSISVFW